MTIAVHATSIRPLVSHHRFKFIQHNHSSHSKIVFPQRWKFLSPLERCVSHPRRKVAFFEFSPIPIYFLFCFGFFLRLLETTILFILCTSSNCSILKEREQQQPNRFNTKCLFEIEVFHSRVFLPHFLCI